MNVCTSSGRFTYFGRSQKVPAIFWTVFAGKHCGKGRMLAEEVFSNHFFPNGDQSHVSEVDGEEAG